jgi:hypothetical protein
MFADRELGVEVGEPSGDGRDPRMFREPRWQATYGGIWLHTRGEAGMPLPQVSERLG